MQLLVNIDHVATLRNARGEGRPDPVEAARICEEAGAKGIVFHLREDRRHIRDEDVHRLKKSVKGLLDFEMAATPEMMDISIQLAPHLVTLVPESREELTTEGGLLMRSVFDNYNRRVVPRFKKAGILMSLFVDPNPEDIELTHRLDAEAIELHTGTYANADDLQKKTELKRLRAAAGYAHSLGLKVNAGHGLDFGNIRQLLDEVPYLNDISIGHALMCDALFNGLANSVERMAAIIHDHPGAAGK
ncbi:MAG: pyridoxine 5'-phosphate synthase [Cyclonatronaceae bacterium]